MKQLHSLFTLLALLLLAAAAALTVMNWPALNTMASWQLGFTEVQLPVGAVILVLAALLFAPLVLAYLRLALGSLIDTRRMVADVQRLQTLADQAEASRIDGLRDFIGREFNRLQARLDSLPTDAGQAPEASSRGELVLAQTPVASPRATALGRWFQAAP